jgi:TP901 family phage tail tape measure protein
LSQQIDAGTIVVTLKANAEGLQKVLIKTDQSLETFSKQADKTAKDSEKHTQKAASAWDKLGKRAHLAILAASAATVLWAKQTIQAGMAYEQSITNTIAITGKLGEEAAAARAEADELARSLGRTTVFSAKQAADALYELSAMGYEVESWAKVMPGVVDFAAATLGDLRQSTELVATTINQFNMRQEEATRVADVFTEAINATAAGQESLAASMAYVGPVASALNVSFEETVAILGKLYDAGYDGSMAGTALRMAMLSITNPTDDAAKKLEKFGVSVEEMSKYGFAEMIRRLHEGGATVSDFAQIFGARAAPAMLSFRQYLADTATGVDALTESLENSGGIAAQTAEEQMNTTQGQVRLLKAALEGLGLSLSRTLFPLIRAGANMLTRPLNAMAEAIPVIADGLSKIPKEAWLFLGVGGSGLFGGAILSLTKVQSGLKKITEAVGQLGKAVRTVAINPYFLATVGVLAVVAGGLYLARKHTEALKASHDSATESAEKLAKSLGLSYQAIQKGTPTVDKATQSTVAFGLANARLINELRNLDAAAKRARIIQVGYSLVMGGVDPDEALKTIAKVLDAAGQAELAVKLRATLDLSSFEDMVPEVGEQVKEILSGVSAYVNEGIGVADVLISPQASEDIEALGDTIAAALNASEIGAAGEALLEVQNALDSSGRSAEENERVFQMLTERFLDMTGLSESLGKNFGDMDSLMRALETSGITSLERFAHVYNLWIDADYDSAVALAKANKEVADESRRLATATDVALGAIDDLTEGMALNDEQLEQLQKEYKEFGDSLLKHFAGPIDTYQNLLDESRKKFDEWNEKQKTGLAGNEDAWEKWHLKSGGSVKQWLKDRKEEQAELETWLADLQGLYEKYQLSEEQLKQIIGLGPHWTTDLKDETDGTIREVLKQLDLTISQNSPDFGESMLQMIMGAAPDAGKEFADQFDKSARLKHTIEQELREADYFGRGKEGGSKLRSGLQAGLGGSLSIGLNFRLSPYEGEGGGSVMGAGSRAALLDYADNFLGAPYVWGGTKPTGWDCSGAVGYWLSHAGIKHPRTAAAMQAYFPAVSVPRPGDLLFYDRPATHVAMYYGNGQQIEARGRKWGTGIWPVRNYTSVGRIPMYDTGGWVGDGIGMPAPRRSTGRPIPILAHENEYVLTENQAHWLAGLPGFATGGTVGAGTYPQPTVPAWLVREMNNLVTALSKTFKGKELTEAIIDAFGERSTIGETYLARERSRTSMMEAYGASSSQIASQIKNNELRVLNQLISEAQEQLDMAVVRKLPAAEINRLQTALWELQKDALDAQARLEELARVPLQEAAEHWSSALSQTQTMFDLLGNASNGLARQTGLFRTQMQQMGGEYSSLLNLMAKSTAPEDIRNYASDALSQLASMFGAERDLIDKTLQDRLDSIGSAREAWETQIAAEDTARTREEERRRAAKETGSLEDQLRILQGQGYYTASDMAQMRDLERQIQEQRDEMARREEEWERTDAIEAQRAAYEAQQSAAEAAAQAQIDNLVDTYEKMMKEVMNRESQLLGSAAAYQNAGVTLGNSLASGLLASLPNITAAGGTIAEALAKILELHSPAKEGPLSTLDTWWESFVPTLVKPLDIYRPERAAVAVASAVRGGVVTESRHEEHIYLHVPADSGLDEARLADLVTDRVEQRLKRKVQVRAGSRS